MSDDSRRRFLRLTGVTTLAAVAGCSSGGTAGDESGDGETTAPASGETDGGGVPAAYRTATAIGGTQRNPDGLSAQSAVNYQPEPESGQQCSGCAYYIEDKNGDGMGACAIVEGTVAPEGYCVSYVSHEE
jgi:hypothetical protein